MRGRSNAKSGEEIYVAEADSERALEVLMGIGRIPVDES